MGSSETNNNSELKLSQIFPLIIGTPWLEFLITAMRLGSKLIRGYDSEGMYEVQEYESTFELHDVKGKSATFKKKKIRYLQNNIIAYPDYAWGDGKLWLKRIVAGVGVAKSRLPCGSGEVTQYPAWFRGKPTNKKRLVITQTELQGGGGGD